MAASLLSVPSRIARPAAHDAVVDARGGYVLPGFIQTHVHLCQTLFRGYADDLTADGLAAHARLADGSGAHAAARCAPPRGSASPSSSRPAPPPC